MRDILGHRILVIGAHPDDEVLGCGGLIAANNAANGKTDVLIVSEGSAAQYANNPAASARRKSQLASVASIVGIDNVHHWDYPDMRLDSVAHLELNSRIHTLITEGAYEFVFTHHPYDVNLDHQVVFRSSMVATRPTPQSPVRGLFTYFVNSSTEWGIASAAERFVPSCFLDISEYLDVKLRALGVYEEELREFPHPRSIEAVKNRALVFGADAGLQAAEAFNVIYWR